MMGVYKLVFCVIIMHLLLGQQVSLGQQAPQEYFDLAEKADSLYRAKAYQEAARTYTAAFKLNNWKGYVPDLYNSARAWAQVSNLDSAFRKLDRVITYSGIDDFKNYRSFPTEPAFSPLKKDKRWQALLTKADTRFNNPLVQQLDTIFREDQKYRLMVDSVAKAHGFESKEMQSLWQRMAAVDSINLRKVKAILDKHGWLGAQEVGQQGNTTLFLVIQHADSATQAEYLPLMREAVQKGNANAGSLALLEDRVALSQGKKQIYGSQIGRDTESGEYCVLPLEDPDNVDKRRAAVGLQPLAEYIKRWGITWDAEQHKKEARRK
ncbi:DUF6624 domain-containing protein [Pontibacter pamirensis]|uniref:DUF6624 domain-containing protein n=1 Tax=Pontibacter pamirensis TaxID=2562824 RepID=UPI001389E933|nr:DUF6624 domain-containing protein [Pontibacter pamirensis]